MGRDIDREIPEIPTAEIAERAPVPAREMERPRVREQDMVPPRDRGLRLNESERQTLFEIGRFRTVAVQDLANHRYRGESSRMQRDVDSLLAQGLAVRRTAHLTHGRGTLVVLVLTKAGKRLLERSREPSSDQVVYSGFVKPAEVAHDAAIYRMFHKEAGQIESQGGFIRRIVLDYELKRNVYSPLAKVRSLPRPEYAKRQAEVARENGLRVVRGRIPLPDLRIEYDTAQGERTHIDLELATHHYHGSHLQTKADAGFKIYTEGGVRTPVFEERELTADILSL